MGYLLETNGLCKHYHRAGSTVEVLRGVDFRLEPGGTAAIVGRSGSGRARC